MKALLPSWAILLVFCANVLARAPLDFDGDGKTDISVYRQSTGTWWIKSSADGHWGAVQFGSSTDKLVPADYTGDGKDDVAFFRPSTNEWFIFRSENNSYYSFQFGLPGDVLLPADYDGDGKADPAVFRPSNGLWFIARSTGGVAYIQWGDPNGGDRAAPPADYDGDGKADLAILSSCCSFKWWVLGSSSGARYFEFNVTSALVPGDYTGDGKADPAYYWSPDGSWRIKRSEDGVETSIHSENPDGCRLSPGDYDGDGKIDPAFFIVVTNNNWYIKRSSDGLTVRDTFGLPTDLGVASANKGPCLV